MKYISAFAFLALMVVTDSISGCKKGSSYMNSIKITGPNYSVPTCNSSFFAVWQGVTTADSLVTLSNTPESIGLTGNSTFPVYMLINWKANTPTCDGMITITSYQRY